MAEQRYERHAHRPRLSGVAGIFTLIAMALFAIVVVRQPSLVTLGLLSLSIAVATLVVISRVYIVSLQDRIIRLEMHGRLSRLGRDRDFGRLSIKQITALRFASDAELPALLDKTIAENLTPDQIKRAVVNWQADHYRT
ncbi:MAG TPA: DUF6526 family protein [Vicinamibacterales bacterium]|jgi:Family of unknown function (DUF6526)|nr:DUF6526 family protein [Vicinamibacterales bacterium]